MELIFGLNKGSGMMTIEADSECTPSYGAVGRGYPVIKSHFDSAPGHVQIEVDVAGAGMILRYEFDWGDKGVEYYAILGEIDNELTGSYTYDASSETTSLILG